MSLTPGCSTQYAIGSASTASTTRWRGHSSRYAIGATVSVPSLTALPPTGESTRNAPRHSTAYSAAPTLSGPLATTATATAATNAGQNALLTNGKTPCSGNASPRNAAGTTAATPSTTNAPRPAPGLSPKYEGDCPRNMKGTVPFCFTGRRTAAATIARKSAATGDASAAAA